MDLKEWLTKHETDWLNKGKELSQYRFINETLIPKAINLHCENLKDLIEIQRDKIKEIMNKVYDRIGEEEYIFQINDVYGIVNFTEDSINRTIIFAKDTFWEGQDAVIVNDGDVNNDLWRIVNQKPFSINPMNQIR